MDENLRPLFSAASVGGCRHAKQAGAASVLIHATILTLLLTLAGGPAIKRERQPRTSHASYVLLAPLLPRLSHGGGGGGGRSLLRANFGQVPRFAKHQLVPPSPVTTESFVLQVEPTLVGPPDTPVPPLSAKNWGDPTALPGPPSPGRGCCSGIGDGRGGGIGPDDGPGLGPGPGTTGYNNVWVPNRDGVSAPIPIYKVEPDYSEEARKAKFQGTVVIELVIDEHGYPTNFKITNPLGLGLDEKAVEAVRKWRFLPGRKNGKPVAVFAKVEVTFRLL